MLPTEIHFGEGNPPYLSYLSTKWELLERHLIEFFPNDIYDVTLISTETPNLTEYLNKIIDGNPMAIDLEWETELCLFQFCSSKGVLIIRHPDGPGNEDLCNFIKNNKFYGKGMWNDFIHLKQKFNFDFHSLQNIEDIAKTRLVPYHYSENFREMTIQFAGKPTDEFKNPDITKSDWSVPSLSVTQVIYAAFDVVALFKSYPNFPPPKEYVRAPKVPRVRKQAKPNPTNIGRKVQPKGKFNILFKRVSIKRTYPFIVNGYRGTVIPTQLRKIFESDDLDIVSTFTFKDKTYLFVSWFNPKEIKDIKVECDSITKIESNIDPKDSTDYDFLFMKDFPIENTDVLEDLFICFGTNTTYSVKDSYIIIEPRLAKSSYLMKLFLPNLIIRGTKLEIFDFPHFLPMIRISNLPPTFTIKEIKSLFNGIGLITDAYTLRRSDENVPKSAIVTFSTVNEAEESIQKVNYTNVNGYEIRVARFTEEPHLRFMRQFELQVSENLDSQSLRAKYSKYGTIYQAYYDSRFNYGRVQFYNIQEAQLANTNEPLSQIIPELNTIVIRDLGFQTTDSKILTLCSQFGTITNIITRDLNDLMELNIKEVTFSTSESASKARESLTHSSIDGLFIRTAILNGGHIGASFWKTNQRKQWVTFIDEEDDSLYAQCQTYGTVQRFIFSHGNTYVMMKHEEEAQNILQDINNAYVTTVYDFGNVLNPEELMLTKVEAPNKLCEECKYRIAILIDPILATTTIEQIQSACTLQYINFCHVFINDSPKFEGMKRAIIYTDKNSVANKVYKLIRDYFLGIKEIKPNRVRVEDILNPPPFTFPEPAKREKKESNKQAIVMDPLPNEINEEIIKGLCEGKGKYEMKITKSAVEKDKKRVVIQPIDSRAAKFIFKELNKEYNGIKLSAVRIVKDKVPEPLE
ncbi:3'-5' exonuclease family protein [Histomonas meleagridis]|uniref:3'-5' exonuclease family protein n=1 Tax=Histomonas meleagridis TaxID=135588 RepID=UPI00355A947A|nr:3'-5' exonuclease family protein [Histomonas meleagridis]KAH0804016.1 3'-5' exonuclease family protein [Histomonas meleagridis]